MRNAAPSRCLLAYTGPFLTATMARCQAVFMSGARIATQSSLQAAQDSPVSQSAMSARPTASAVPYAAEVSVRTVLIVFGHNVLEARPSACPTGRLLIASRSARNGSMHLAAGLKIGVGARAALV